MQRENEKFGSGQKHSEELNEVVKNFKEYIARVDEKISAITSATTLLRSANEELALK
jgi:prefoldin subunit 5